MANQFKIGDVVSLKSGGPKMTVNKVGLSYDNEQTVWVDWFDDGKHCEGDFPPDSLKLATGG